MDDETAKMFEIAFSRILAVEAVAIEMLADSEHDISAMHERCSAQALRNIQKGEYSETARRNSAVGIEKAFDGLFATAAALRHLAKEKPATEG